MEEERKLTLSETYIHFNTLVWQVPSWGIAIAAAVIVAATEVGNKETVWVISGKLVQSLILFFGAFLLFALTVALARYRDYQAASAPLTPPKAVFCVKPKANFWLQGAMSLTTGGLFGLGIAQLLCLPWIILTGFIVGILLWWWLERGRSSVLDDIKKWQEKNMAGGNNRLKD